MAGRGSTDFDKAGAAGRLAKEQRERLCQEQGGKYDKYKTDQRQHKTQNNIGPEQRECVRQK